MNFLPIEHFDKEDEEEIISLIKDPNENPKKIHKNTYNSNPRKKLKKNNIINVVHNSILDKKIELFNEKNFTIIRQVMQDNVELKNYLIKTNQTNNVKDTLNNKIISMYILLNKTNIDPN
jgi:hypothetical protein